MVSKILIFIVIVGVANAATFIGRLPPKPRELAHKEGCYITDVEDVIPFNAQVLPVGQCVRITCTMQLINYDTCSTVSTDDPRCHVTDVDHSKAYPQCCPDIKCDIDNNLQ